MYLTLHEDKHTRKINIMSFGNIADLCVIMVTVFTVFSLMVIAFIAICINVYLALRAAYDKAQVKAKKKAFVAGWNSACKNNREWYISRDPVVTHTVVPIVAPVTAPAPA
jgi:hypothetical protein